MNASCQFATGPAVRPPKIRVTRTASREAVETQLDLEKMLAAAVMEQARYFHAIAGALLETGRMAFAAGARAIAESAGTGAETLAHIRRLAEILTATRMLGRVRVRKEVGLPLASDLQFAEVLHGIGVDQAVEYLRSLPVATREEWLRLLEANQGPAFTAAGVENKAALEALRDLVGQALDRGWTAAEFEQGAMELLAKFQEEAGALRTLWNTVTATAMARGREEMLDDPEVKKIVAYRLYDAIIDSRTRPNHAALDGGIAPADWEGWPEYAPPNGFNCRCTLVGITAVRARRMLESNEGFDLTVKIPVGAGPDPGFK